MSIILKLTCGGFESRNCCDCVIKLFDILWWGAFVPTVPSPRIHQFRPHKRNPFSTFESLPSQRLQCEIPAELFRKYLGIWHETPKWHRIGRKRSQHRILLVALRRFPCPLNPRIRALRPFRRLTEFQRLHQKVASPRRPRRRRSRSRRNLVCRISLQRS